MWLLRSAIVLLTLLNARPVHATIIAGERALVSRTRSDIRTMATALEAYHVDQGLYPLSSGFPDWQIVDHALTTPTAYLNSELRDVFKSVRAVPVDHPRISVALGLASVWIVIALLLMALVALVQMVIRARDRTAESVANAIKGNAWLIAIFPAVLVALLILFAPVGFGAPDSHIRSNRDWRDRPQGFCYWSDGESGWILQSPGPDGAQDLVDLSSVPLDGRSEGRMLRLAPFSYDPTNGHGSNGDVFRISGQADPARR